MPNWDEDIDGNHLKIAAHQGKTMRVLAGPGTGKSYAMQRRVMRLLQEGRDPTRILAVTFTNVAADDLKKNLAAIGIPGAELVRARTLHSLCFEILKKEHVFEITHRTPRPLMSFEQNFLLEDLMEEFGKKKKTQELLIAFESVFARQQQDAPGVQTDIDRRFKERLLQWLTFHKAMLIGEVIPITYEYLHNNPTAPELTQFDFILVDEYQDLNKAEQLLIDALAQSAELLVVGDDDQSIYSFKHAHPEGIVEFLTTHAPLEDVGLQICRRCPKKVVRLANELMGYSAGNQKRLEEFSPNDEGEVFAVQWQTAEDEIKGIAKIIRQIVSEDSYGLRPEDILVLSPRRRLGYQLRDELQNKFAIGSHTFFQEEALETQKAQKAYAILSYFVNPDDRVTFRALLGIPTTLPKTYQKILEKAEELSITPKEVLNLIKKGEVHIARSEELIERYEAIEEIRQSLQEKSLEEIVQQVFTPNDPADIEILLSIINMIGLGPDLDVATFFSRLQDRIRLPEVTEESGYVKIMSLHKSKGLTSRAVFILGCVAGLMPFIKDEQELIATNQTEKLRQLREEAKRLFFVALTRTKKYLFLSSFRQIDFGQAMQLSVRVNAVRGQQTAQTQTSPFFGEMARELPAVITGENLLTRFRVTHGDEPISAQSMD